MKIEMNDNSAGVSYALLAWVGGIGVLFIVAFFFLNLIRSNRAFDETMAAKGYIQCPRSGSTEWDWMPAGACPVAKASFHPPSAN